jgi:hypothetical protein
MKQLTRWLEEPDFLSLIRICCSDNSDGPFEKFQSVWHPYLQAALARFVSDWTVAEMVCRAAYNDYKTTFRCAFNPQFDYTTYFIAVAYTHLVRITGDRSIRKLLKRISGGILGVGSGQYEIYVLTFCAIFRTNDSCVFHLLENCFKDAPAKTLDLTTLMRYLPSETANCESRLWAVLRCGL